jgi:hypothetical protein
MAQVGAYSGNQVMLGATPKEGPMAVAWNVDFTANTQYVFDLTAIQQQARISMIQTLFLDNSLSSVPLFVVCATSNQSIEIPPNSQAYMPVVLTNKISVTLSSTSGRVIPIQALNIAMNAAVWSVNGTPTVTNGAMIVSDPILEAAVSSGKFVTTPMQLSGDGATYAPVSLDTRMVSVNIAAVTSTAVITAPTGSGWVVKSIDILLSPDAVQATSGENSVILLENATVIARSGIAMVPASAPTFAAAAAPLALLRKEGINLTSKVVASTLNVQMGNALTAGAATVNVTYALTPFVGG